jgi:hypothetical protein
MQLALAASELNRSVEPPLKIKKQKTVINQIEKGLMLAPYVTVNPQLVKTSSVKSPYFITEK